MSNNNVPDSFTDADDMFADTRMSIGDHIEDLRTHLIRAIKGFLVGMVIGLWPLGPWVLGIITAPVEKQLYEFEARKLKRQWDEDQARMKAGGYTRRPVNTKIRFRKREWREAVGLPTVPATPNDKVGEDTIQAFENVLYDLDVVGYLEKDVRNRGNFIDLDVQIVDSRELDKAMLDRELEVRKPEVKTMEITEAFMTYFKVSLVTGLVISSPWVFYHIWMFIAAGLYPHEKKLVNVYLPFSLFLFISGVLVCQFLVMPKAIAAMLWFNEWLGMSADMRLNEWLSFAVMMPVVFGASFQTPLVMVFLHKVGILTVQTYREYRKIAWFVMAIFAAIITPSVDAMSMLFLWVPMGALYELGILICVWQGEQNRLFEWEEEEKKTGELVEV
jgi:sec-independent protein translocase protein TatC